MALHGLVDLLHNFGWRRGATGYRNWELGTVTEQVTQIKEIHGHFYRSSALLRKPQTKSFMEVRRMGHDRLRILG